MTDPLQCYMGRAARSGIANTVDDLIRADIDAWNPTVDYVRRSGRNGGRSLCLARPVGTLIFWWCAPDQLPEVQRHRNILPLIVEVHPRVAADVTRWRADLVKMDRQARDHFEGKIPAYKPGDPLRLLGGEFGDVVMRFKEMGPIRDGEPTVIGMADLMGQAVKLSAPVSRVVGE